MNTIYLDNNQYKFLVISLKVKLDYFNEICVILMKYVQIFVRDCGSASVFQSKYNFAISTRLFINPASPKMDEAGP